jgi:2C-methyl-D-erythritol 2,4-cyclodiphosphate synthase
MKGESCPFAAAVGIVTVWCGLLVAMPRPATAQSEADAKAAVHQVVDALVAAIDRNDVDAFERLIAPDYTFVTPAGQVWPKPSTCS